MTDALQGMNVDGDVDALKDALDIVNNPPETHQVVFHPTKKWMCSSTGHPKVVKHGDEDMKSLADCQKICGNNIDCKAIEYENAGDNSRCFLFESVQRPCMHNMYGDGDKRDAYVALRFQDGILAHPHATYDHKHMCAKRHVGHPVETMDEEECLQHTLEQGEDAYTWHRHTKQCQKYRTPMDTHVNAGICQPLGDHYIAARIRKLREFDPSMDPPVDEKIEALKVFLRTGEEDGGGIRVHVMDSPIQPESQESQAVQTGTSYLARIVEYENGGRFKVQFDEDSPRSGEIASVHYTYMSI